MVMANGRERAQNDTVAEKRRSSLMPLTGQQSGRSDDGDESAT